MTSLSERPRVGIVSDIVLQRHRLQEAASRFGLDVCFSGDPDRLLAYPSFPDANLWLITLEDEADHPALFDHVLENTEAPVLFGLDLAPKPGFTEYFRWERRLLDKLEQSLGHLEQLDSADEIEELAQEPATEAGAPALSQWITPAAPGSVAEEVWILGASLGGPAAVKTFLDNVVLMPVEREWAWAEDGTLIEKDTPWPGPYGPSIDQVLLNVGDHFGARCSAIIFSGMGNDGAIAAPLLKAYGSRVWVQETTSCGNSSMPDSVAATGCSEFCGTPEQLARELVKKIEESCLLKGRQKRDSA